MTTSSINVRLGDRLLAAGDREKTREVQNFAFDARLAAWNRNFQDMLDLPEAFRRGDAEPRLSRRPRAQDASFDITLEREFDPGLAPIE